MITTKKLYKTFGSGDGQVQALRPTDLSLEKGGFYKVLGPSGSGKSTLLNLLAGLMHPSGGTVEVDGISLYKDLNQDGLARFRREYLGFIFQSFNLMPYMTAIENVMLPLTPLDLSKSEKRLKAEAALKKVGLLDRKDHKPGELSGGQQQRVAIARAIVNEPPILFADEPTGNLDSHTRSEIDQLFESLNEMGHTILMVTHNRESIGPKDKLLYISDGAIELTAEREEQDE